MSYAELQEHIHNLSMKKSFVIAVLLFILTSSSTWAQVSLATIFSDNMVFQQGKKVNVWGQATPGESITLRFQEQTKKVIADEAGQWFAQLDELTATKKAQRLTVKGRKNKIELNNILIGEVWLVSGQSNMEYSMNNHPRYSKPKKGDPEYLSNAFKHANNPLIRVLYVKKELKSDTLPTNGWQMASGEALAPVSAIGYFYAKSLTENLDVPVGIISTSWGGTPIETWTPEKAYADSPAFQKQLKNHKLDGVAVGERFEKMVKPIIPYSLKGFLWYQGEQNLIYGDVENYADKQNLLVETWRSAWHDSTLPFYYVQLAPYLYSQRKQDVKGKAWDALPRFWEVQTSCMETPHTGMVVTTDLVENLKDIHPSYKWIVAERLARWALAKDYGKTGITYSGPVYKSLSTKGNEVTLEFEHTGSGLTTNDGKAPDWFYVRTKKGRYEKAKTITIEGDKVIITHDQLSHPVSIRFAWDETATPNLINKEGLPAIPFRIQKDY